MEYLLLHSKEWKVGKNLWARLIKQKVLPWQMFGHTHRDSVNVDETGRL